MRGYVSNIFSYIERLYVTRLVHVNQFRGYRQSVYTSAPTPFAILRTQKDSQHCSSTSPHSFDAPGGEPLPIVELYTAE